MMRLRILVTAIVLLLSAAHARAQQPPAPSLPAPATGTPLDLGPVRQQGSVDVGVRSSSVEGDRARFGRFRDMRDGPFLSGFRFERETPDWFVRGEAGNVGYRDQRFMARADAIGRVKAGFTWDQIPLFISGDTRSLQRDLGNGVLDVDDAIQAAVQNRTLTLANASASAVAFDLRSRRHIAAFDLTYAAARDVDVTVRVKNSARQGYNLQSFGLGGNFSQELGIPIDDRTTDVRLGVEWANTRGMLSAGINASWFENNLPLVRFDNPQRTTDLSGSPATGVAVMWPSNSLVSVVASGSYKLPARTRATAAISIGRANQNEPLAAPTSNTALVAPPLMRTTAETAADVISMVYGLNSRPAEHVWLNARYRYYDYANTTPHFETRPIVADGTLGTAVWENEPLSVRRQTLDLDGSYTPFRYASFGAGYTREASARSFRIFENTVEDVFRVTADSITGNAFNLRLKYEWSDRHGSNFNAHVLEEVEEQPDMRHFDVANRERRRASALLTVTPLSWLMVNASVADGRDDYADTGFGLRDNRNRAYGGGVDLALRETVTLGVSCEREKYTANQYSRTAQPGVQFTDPTRDWALDTTDRVDTVMATLDMLRTIPKMDIRLGYDLSDGEATYVYGLPADQRVFTTVALAQLPQVRNRLKGARADVQYFVRPDIAVGVVYRYEDYAVRDFALDATNMTSLVAGTSAIYSGYLYRPYTAHTGWLRVTYLW